VVAAVQGMCFAGGLEFAVRSDVIFAARSASFGHPEQSLGIVRLLGGVYRIAERAGRSRAVEWALTSERVSAAEMERFGVVNHVVDDDLVERATAFAGKVAQGPTRAHAAHTARLRAWAVGVVTAADEIMFDVAIPLWDTEDVKVAIPSAVNAFKAGQPRPAVRFMGC
jgi:enoyl-CoA hydratase/carnithine racemase